MFSNYENLTQTKTAYHITLAEAKAHLNIEADYDEDDTYITELIKDATAEAESFIDGDIAATTNIMILTDFYHDLIHLRRTPFRSLTSIAWEDDDGNTGTIDLSTVITRKGTMETLLELNAWLDALTVTVTYESGYASSATVPRDIRRAILYKIADLYDTQRGSFVSQKVKDSKAFERALYNHQKTTY